MGRYFIGENPSHYLSHSGRLGQRWGVRNGPPYPLNREAVSRAYGVSSKLSKYALSAQFGSRKKIVNGFPVVKKRAAEVSIEEEAQKVNPKRRGDKYRDYNCGYCAIAYDMRRRGYDVIAADKHLITTDQLLHSYTGLKGQMFSGFLGEKEWNSIKVPNAERSSNMAKWVNTELRKQGIGARGFFTMAMGEGAGHAMNYEVTNTGVKLIDSQSGDVYRVGTITKYATDVIMVRTDTAEPKYDMIKRKGMVLNA